MGSVKAVDAHYERHFGAEPEYWKFENRPGTIGVLEWPKETSRHPFHLYATLGLHALVPAFLEPGHLVTPEEGRIFADLHFRSWLMLERVDDFIPPLQLENGHHVVFLDATPVFPEEASIVKERGLDGLFDLWDEDPPRLSDLNRNLPAPLGA